MKLKIIFLVMLVLSAFYAKAQDPAIAGINPDKSPLMVGETTIIQADVLNGSSAPIPLANLAIWTINLPPNVVVESIEMDDPSTSSFLTIYQSAYDAADGTTIQIISDKGDFPGGSAVAGAYVALITVKGVKITTPGSPAPMSINAVTDIPVGTNNSGNDNTSSSIVVIPSTPVAQDDMASTPPSTPVTITLFGNDTPGASAIAPATPASYSIVPTSVKLIDPSNGSSVTTLIVPGEGTYVVNADGTVTFIPLPTFNGSTATPVKYTFQDSNGGTSNQADITVTVGPLPVTLVSFNVSPEGKTALLRWATTEETNSEYFEIQHSVTGKEWAEIGRIASHGESNTLKSYTFTHSAPVNGGPSHGENLYRLKMVDKDATYAYSRIQSVKFDGIGSDLSVYPNPVTDKLFIRDFSQVTQVKILDMNGRNVYETAEAATGEVDVKNLSTGIYIVNITRSNGIKSSQKIVISK